MLNKLPKIKFQFKNPFKNWSKKKKIFVSVITVVAIGVIAVFISFNSRKNQMRENMAASFTTETAKIERQTLTNSISATGTVESAETKTVNTKMTNMEVLSVYLKEGDYVEEGTVICEFDSSDYEEELAKAQHNASINAQIEALEGDYTDDYNDTLDAAFDPLEEAAASKNDAADSYDEAAEELSSAESSLSSAASAYNKAKAAYEAIADELNATPNALTTYEKEYNDALNELAAAQVKLSEAKKAE